jgi:AcrR family transcriptional regulator
MTGTGTVTGVERTAARRSPDGETSPNTGRRSYNSPLRRQQAAETRRRILVAGAELARVLPSWDWTNLTFRAVAERAAVGQRTVYRYFPTERQLHDAIMERLEQEAGVSYEDLTLASMPAVALRVFDAMQAFQATPGSLPRRDPAFGAEDDKRRRALRLAVESVGAVGASWTDTQKNAAAAAFDILWCYPAYVRLTVVWGLDHEHATDVIGWLIETLVDAVEAGSHPPKARNLRRKRGS